MRTLTGRPCKPLILILSSFLCAASSPAEIDKSTAVHTDPSGAHTDPINLTNQVREAHEHFYNLDYEGALSRFEAIQRANPQSALATDYVLMVLVFRELYHQDLLDTTYYAHDNFLTSKRDVPVPDATRQRIESLTDSAVSLCDRRIKANGNDKNAWFARGYARGMHAAFITLVDHSFVAAARQGLAARNDSEQVLKIDPDYADAKMAVGIQQFAVASLPRVLRLMIGVAGVSGSRERGLDLLRDCAARGIVNNIESRTALSLFLRHDGRYPEALAVQQGLAEQFPRDYLFRLEEANLTKDQGNSSGAIAAYRRVLEDARRPGYFFDVRLQLAYFGLADTQRGQNDYASAVQNYILAAMQPNCSDWLRKRAQLNAGQMNDLLHHREEALALYQLASTGGGDQSQAEAARRFMKAPYTGK